MAAKAQKDCRYETTNSECSKRTEENLIDSQQIYKFETCNEAVMAFKAQEQCQLAQTMVICIVPETEVSLFF